MTRSKSIIIASLRCYATRTLFFLQSTLGQVSIKYYFPANIHSKYYILQHLFSCAQKITTLTVWMTLWNYFGAFPVHLTPSIPVVFFIVLTLYSNLSLLPPNCQSTAMFQLCLRFLTHKGRDRCESSLRSGHAAEEMHRVVLTLQMTITETLMPFLTSASPPFTEQKPGFSIVVLIQYPFKHHGNIPSYFSDHEINPRCIFTIYKLLHSAGRQLKH